MNFHPPELNMLLARMYADRRLIFVFFFCQFTVAHLRQLISWFQTSTFVLVQLTVKGMNNKKVWCPQVSVFL